MMVPARLREDILWFVVLLVIVAAVVGGVYTLLTGGTLFTEPPLG